MKKFVRSLLACAFLCSAIPGATLPSHAPRPAPEFVIQQANGGQQLLLSSYKGKPVVLVLMYATCPHCQHTAGLLSQLQGEFTAKGVQTLGAVFNDGDASLVEQFKRQFHPAFPVGYSNIPSVLTFIQWPKDQLYYVPILVFIDKKGIIRQQIVGDEKFYEEKNQMNNIRAEVDKLLKPAAAPTISSTRKKAAKSE